jgi:hypothetical protein
MRRAFSVTAAVLILPGAADARSGPPLRTAATIYLT